MCRHQNGIKRGCTGSGSLSLFYNFGNYIKGSFIGNKNKDKLDFGVFVKGVPASPYVSQTCPRAHAPSPHRFPFVLFFF